MTEQEIINVLKENKTKGVAYLFLPEDVWDWIGENFNNPKLMYLAPNGQWRLFSETDFDDCDNVAFALPDDYQIKKEEPCECEEESEHKDIADSMLLAARVLHSNCIKINCQKCVLCRNEECILNLHPLYWNLN